MEQKVKRLIVSIVKLSKNERVSICERGRNRELLSLDFSELFCSSSDLCKVRHTALV